MIKSIITDKVELAKVSYRADINTIEGDMIADAVITDLLETAEHHRTKGKVGCAGLAANQIGYLLRVVVIWTGTEWLVMVNPSWEPRDGKQGQSHEGCLSRPGVNAKVKRYKRIKCSWVNDQGVKQSRKFNHFLARVIQHECDHLDGVFI